jgi:hypothetical protein
MNFWLEWLVNFLTIPFLAGAWIGAKFFTVTDFVLISIVVIGILIFSAANWMFAQGRYLITVDLALSYFLLVMLILMLIFGGYILKTAVVMIILAAGITLKKIPDYLIFLDTK